MHNSPPKSHALTVSSLRATSEASLASSATPTKAIPAIEQETPQSGKNNVCDEAKAFATAVDAPGSSSTKTRKNSTKKRSRASPDKKVSKKLFSGEEARDDGGDSDGVGLGAINQISPIKDA